MDMLILPIVIIGLLTGMLIGTVGVGGVLLAPFLYYGLRIDLHAATAMSSWSFLFTGIVGTMTYWRRDSISWELVKWLSLGIIPGALVGAAANSILPNDGLILVLAVLILASGANSLLSPPGTPREAAAFSRLTLLALGILTGFGSALTGTGGPVILVPVLLLLKIPPLLAIAAGQAAQVPVSVFASLGNSLFGEIDLLLGSLLGLIQSLGVVVGANITHAIQPNQLRRIVAYALIGVGGGMIWRFVA